MSVADRGRGLKNTALRHDRAASLNEHGMIVSADEILRLNKRVAAWRSRLAHPEHRIAVETLGLNSDRALLLTLQQA
jgi:hypothetical protein